MLLNDWIVFLFSTCPNQITVARIHDLHGIGPCHIHLLLSFSKKTGWNAAEHVEEQHVRKVLYIILCETTAGLPRTRQTPHFVKSESWHRKVIEQRSNHYKWLNSRPIYAYLFFDKPLQYPYQSSNVIEIWRGFEHWEVKIETSDVRGVG